MEISKTKANRGKLRSPNSVRSGKGRKGNLAGSSIPRPARAQKPRAGVSSPDVHQQPQPSNIIRSYRTRHSGVWREAHAGVCLSVPGVVVPGLQTWGARMNHPIRMSYKRIMLNAVAANALWLPKLPNPLFRILGHWVIPLTSLRPIRCSLKAWPRLRSPTSRDTPPCLYGASHASLGSPALKVAQRPVALVGHPALTWRGVPANNKLLPGPPACQNEALALKVARECLAVPWLFDRDSDAGLMFNG